MVRPIRCCCTLPLLTQYCGELHEIDVERSCSGLTSTVEMAWVFYTAECPFHPCLTMLYFLISAHHDGQLSGSCTRQSRVRRDDNQCRLSTSENCDMG